MTIIAVTNQKGGVGKTTLSYNIAKGLVKRNKKILLVDNDPQSNLTSIFFDNPETDLTSNILNFYEANNKSKINGQLIEDNLYIIGSNIHLSKIAENGFDVIFQLHDSLNFIKEDYDFIIIDCLPSFGYLHMAALKAADYALVPTKAAPFAISGMKDLFETIDKVKLRLAPSSYLHMKSASLWLAYFR